MPWQNRECASPEKKRFLSKKRGLFNEKEYFLSYKALKEIIFLPGTRDEGIDIGIPVVKKCITYQFFYTGNR